MKLEAAVLTAMNHTGSTSAYSAMVPQLLKDPQVQGELVALLQASAAASGASWAGVSQVIPHSHGGSLLANAAGLQCNCWNIITSQ